MEGHHLHNLHHRYKNTVDCLRVKNVLRDVTDIRMLSLLFDNKLDKLQSREGPWERGCHERSFCLIERWISMEI